MANESERAAAGNKQDKQETLLEMEDSLGSVISNLHESIVIIDPEYTTINVNEVFLRTTDYKHEEIIGYLNFF